MKKITLLMAAALMLAATAMAEMKVTTVWQKSTATSNAYAWNTGSSSRDMDHYAGKLYMTDRTNGQIHVIDAATGIEQTTQVITNTAFSELVSVFAANNGTIYAYTSTTSGTPSFYSISGTTATLIGSGTSAVDLGYMDHIGMTFTQTMMGMPITVNGALIGATCSGTEQCTAFPFAMGSLQASFQQNLDNVRGGTSYANSDMKSIDDSTVWITGENFQPIRATLHVATLNCTATRLNLPPRTTSGFAFFTLNHTDYVVVPRNNFGSVAIYNATNLNQPVLIDSTSNLGTNEQLRHCAIEAQVTADTVYIYVHSTNNGTACYKFCNQNTPSTPHVISLPYTQTFAVVDSGSSQANTTSNFPLTMVPGLYQYKISKDTIVLNGIDSLVNVYGAGKKIRLSTSSKTGILYTAPVNTNGTSKITVNFTAAGWSGKTSSVIVCYGSQSDTLTIAGKTFPVKDNDMTLYSTTFNALATPTIISFMAYKPTGTNTDRRFFIDSIVINKQLTAQVAQPVITPAAGPITAPVTVSITCATANAAIYYTTDGTTPDSSSTLYTAPFIVNTTTTVKAIATKTGMNDSEIAAATYTAPTEVADIAAFIAARAGTYRITGTVTAVYQSTRNLYIQDASGSLLLYGNTDTTYNNGDQLTGIVGQYATYQGAAQMVPLFLPDAVNGTPVTPTNTTIGNITTTDVHKYMKLCGVQFVSSTTYTNSTTNNGDVTDGTDTIVVRNNFRVINGTYAPGTNYDIEGFVSVYKGAVQFYPISIMTSPATGINVAESDLDVYVHNGTIYVPTATGTSVEVYAVTGQLIFHCTATDATTAISNLPQGQILLVRNGTQTAKIVL